MLCKDLDGLSLPIFGGPNQPFNLVSPKSDQLSGVKVTTYYGLSKWVILGNHLIVFVENDNTCCR